MLANMWLLAEGYGSPQIYSSFTWGPPANPPANANDDDKAGKTQSPPSNADGLIANASCTNNLWTCDHRDAGIVAMIGWHKYVGSAPRRNFYTDEFNVIAFSKGNRGWAAFNNGPAAKEIRVQTGLPGGTYCDVVNDTPATGCSAPVTVGSTGFATVRCRPTTRWPSTGRISAERTNWTRARYSLGECRARVPSEEVLVAMTGGLTTTSYAILGLLAVQSWSTYELTQQMDRSLGRFWPRAQSKLYEEPRKLVNLGLASCASEHVGRRPRTVYTITDDGRAELARWMAEPAAGPVLEFEQLLKLFLAESGTRDDALRRLAEAREWAVEQNALNLAAARAYREGVGPFEQRAAQGSLVGGFLTEFYALVAEWAERSAEVVARWPDDVSQARSDPDLLAEIAARAAWSESKPDEP